MTNDELYGKLPKVSVKIKAKRMQLAGHLVRHPEEEVASKLVLWEPLDGAPNRGRRATDFVDQLKRDTGLPDTEAI